MAAPITYPKMLSGVDGTTGRTTNLVYPPGNAKQGTYVLFKTAAEEAAYDGTGVPAIGSVGFQENHHHN